MFLELVISQSPSTGKQRVESEQNTHRQQIEKKTDQPRVNFVSMSSYFTSPIKNNTQYKKTIIARELHKSM